MTTGKLNIQEESLSQETPKLAVVPPDPGLPNSNQRKNPEFSGAYLGPPVEIEVPPVKPDYTPVEEEDFPVVPGQAALKTHIPMESP